MIITGRAEISLLGLLVNNCTFNECGIDMRAFAAAVNFAMKEALKRHAVIACLLFECPSEGQVGEEICLSWKLRFVLHNQIGTRLTEAVYLGAYDSVDAVRDTLPRVVVRFIDAFEDSHKEMYLHVALKHHPPATQVPSQQMENADG